MKIALKVVLIFCLESFTLTLPQLSIGQVYSYSHHPTAPNLTYITYCNARFSYCVDYPEELLVPQRESENGDGRIFTDRNGQEVLRVFGRNNSDPDFGNISLKKQFSDDLKDVKQNNNCKITYQKLGTSYFVISGTKNGKVFYQKTIVKQDAFAYAILQYDRKEKQTYDRVSEKLFRSFK